MLPGKHYVSAACHSNCHIGTQRNHMESRQLSEWDQIRIQRSMCKQSTNMILVRSFVLKNKEFQGKEGVHWGRDDASPEISTSSGWSWRGVNPNSHSFASIWVVGGKDNWKTINVYQIRCRKWNSVQVYQFRLNKMSNGRASSNQQNRLQNVWLSSPFAQFVSPWAICGSVTPLLASLLCSWGSDIINCYTIKIYTKYYDYDCMWVSDESESLTTSYQIIF